MPGFADAVADDRQLELGEGDQHVGHGPTERRREVQRRVDPDKCLAVLLQPLVEHQEVEQRTRQPVVFGDDQAISVIRSGQPWAELRAVERADSAGDVEILGQADHLVIVQPGVGFDLMPLALGRGHLVGQIGEV
jgi:hypothetical protein